MRSNGRLNRSHEYPLGEYPCCRSRRRSRFCGEVEVPKFRFRRGTQLVTHDLDFRSFFHPEECELNLRLVE